MLGTRHVTLVFHCSSIADIRSPFPMRCFLPYLFGYIVPLLMADAHVHALLVEELALLWNQKHVTHKLAHCNRKSQGPIHLLVTPTICPEGEKNRLPCQLAA